MELELHVPELPQIDSKPSRRKKIRGWISKRFALRNSLDHYGWRVATGSTALFSSLAIGTAALGMPTGSGTIIDVLFFIALNLGAMSLAAVLLSFLFNVISLPIPRRFAAVFLYSAAECYLVLYFAELGELMSAIIALIFTLIGSIIGLLLALLMKLRLKAVVRASLGLAIAIAIAVTTVIVDWPAPAAVPQREAAIFQATDGAGADQSRNMVDPSMPGLLAFKAFTYGSGADKHRSIFGKDVDMKSTAVDASPYITKWGKLKQWFWGFDEKELPLNGRVWMPEGEGPFPIALIVHGNHLMEDFSDGGYGYLGELLASKGIIAVSLDENFLNYSVWSGIPNNDMKVRAWVLLKHLQQIQQFSENSDNSFYQRVDFEKVALIGHSRGGQAVAMAADADRWFIEDDTLESLENVVIDSVIAIAPTDKQVDDKSASLSDVNYLTLQGASDADVNIFYGERQYGRTTFQKESNKFKSALYIANANHSQFNSDWGRMDERLPGGLFLSRKQLLQAEEQRQISKVYVSAFLQATLLGQESYKALLKDYRTGQDWLPETIYLNRYEEADFTEITRYDAGIQKTEIKGSGKATVSGMKDWQIAAAEDRDGKSKGTKGIELEWEEPGAEYALELTPMTLKNAQHLLDGSLVFSMANMERDLLTEDKEEEASSEAAIAAELPPLPVVEIQLTTLEGDNIELELGDVMPPAPPVYTSFMSISWLEERMKEEKYTEANEPVFQTFVLPIELFNSEELTIEPQEISRITFRFVSGPGKVMIDDIGFMS